MVKTKVIDKTGHGIEKLDLPEPFGMFDNIIIKPAGKGKIVDEDAIQAAARKAVEERPGRDEDDIFTLKRPGEKEVDLVVFTWGGGIGSAGGISAVQFERRAGKSVHTRKIGIL